MNNQEKEVYKNLTSARQNKVSAKQSKNISCCELLTLFQRYYQKKFGVDGMVLFDSEEENIEFAITHALTKSLFNYLSKKEKLCGKCESGWKNLKNN